MTGIIWGRPERRGSKGLYLFEYTEQFRKVYTNISDSI